MTDEEKRLQVADQCRAVAKMSSDLAQLHNDYEKMFRENAGAINDIADLVGYRTASFMETLGDMLNGMDAAEPDAWMTPVFERAQELWPK